MNRKQVIHMDENVAVLDYSLRQGNGRLIMPIEMA